MTRPAGYLEFVDIGKTYAARDGAVVQALSGVSFAVPRVASISILGPSGCGKSTLLKIVLGVVPHDCGEVRLAGQRQLHGPQLGAGMVFQTASLPPWRRVLDNVLLLPIEVLGPKRRATMNPRPAIFWRWPASLALSVNIRMNRSGGTQQRVSICRALIHDPELPLMDEPPGALDALTREVLQTELLRICSETHKTVLFVSQYLIDEAVLVSDRGVRSNARRDQGRLPMTSLHRPRRVRAPPRREPCPNFRPAAASTCAANLKSPPNVADRRAASG